MMLHARLISLVGAYTQKYYLDGVSAPRLRSNLTETVAHAEDYLPGFVSLALPSPLIIGWRKHNPWFIDHYCYSNSCSLHINTDSVPRSI